MKPTRATDDTPSFADRVAGVPDSDSRRARVHVTGKASCLREARHWPVPAPDGFANAVSAGLEREVAQAAARNIVKRGARAITICI